MNIDRAKFVQSLGGEPAVKSMSPEARTDALEDFLMVEVMEKLKHGPLPPPAVAQLEAEIETRPYRHGVGGLFVSARRDNMHLLPKMPEKPTLEDFFHLRFPAMANHCLQSANLAMKNG